MSRLGSCLWVAAAVLLLGVGSPGRAYAVEMTTEAEEAETPAPEEVETDSRAGGIWKSVIDMVKDFFLGPAYDERPDISSIKSLEPYALLGDVAFPGGEAMDEVKDASASFYRLVSAISLIGLILSFMVGGIRIAMSRAKNKTEVQSAILIKVLVFAAIFSITGLWGILVPLLNMLSGG